MCRRHNFWAHTQGCGKTLLTILQILGTYGRSIISGKSKPGAIQIIAPRHTLNHVWLGELAKLNLDQYADVITSPNQFQYSSKPIWIYHYDLLKQQTSKGQAQKKSTNMSGYRIKQTGDLEFIGYPVSYMLRDKFKPRLLVIDEIHRLRKGTDRTKACTDVRSVAKRVIGLSGTPMDGYIEHLATILGFIYGPERVDISNFSKKYTKTEALNVDIVTGGETEGSERPVPGISTIQVPAFLREVSTLMHRLNLSDPEVEKTITIPPHNQHRIIVPLEPNHRKLYDDIYQKAKLEAKTLVGNKAALRLSMLELITKLRQASSSPESIGYTNTSSKLDSIIKIANKFKSEDRKLIIYPLYIDEARTIHQELLAKGIKSLRLYASDPCETPKTLTHDKREDIIERFQDDPSVTCLVASLELISEGLTLVEASGIIRASRPWKATLDMQGLSRVIRPGQTKTVDVYDLVNDSTIDLYVEELLNRKISATSSFMDRDFSKETAGSTIDIFQLGELLFSE